MMLSALSVTSLIDGQTFIHRSTVHSCMFIPVWKLLYWFTVAKLQIALAQTYLTNLFALSDADSLLCSLISQSQPTRML